MKEIFTITTGSGETKKEVWSGDVDFNKIVSGLTPETVKSLAKAQLKIKARAVGMAALEDNADVAEAIEGHDWNAVGGGGSRLPEYVRTIRYIVEITGIKGKDNVKAAEAKWIEEYQNDENIRAQVDNLTEQRKAAQETLRAQFRQ